MNLKAYKLPPTHTLYRKTKEIYREIKSLNLLKFNIQVDYLLTLNSHPYPLLKKIQGKETC